MQFSVVRVIETKQLVGLFVAESEDDLALLVDECCPPYLSEYACLPSGGLMAIYPDVPTLPAPHPEKVDSDDLTVKYFPTMALINTLCDEALEWQRLDPNCQLAGSIMDRVLSTEGDEKLDQMIREGFFEGMARRPL